MSIAYAAASSSSGSSSLLGFLPLVAVVVIFYLFMIRPQQKRQKEKRNKLANLKVGDKIITAGGLLAKVVKVVGQRELLCEISSGVEVTIVRQTILEVINPNPTQPVQKKSMLGSLFGGKK